MESNNTIENEFVINDNLEDININKATEVPLNPIEPSLSPEPDSSPNQENESNVESDKTSEKSTTDDLPKCQPIEETADKESDCKDSDVNKGTNDNETNDDKIDDNKKDEETDEKTDEKTDEETDEKTDDNKTNDDSIKDQRHQYTKEQLIAISKLSLARTRPQCLDNTFNNPANGLWDPEKWMRSKFSSNSSTTVIPDKYNYNKRERQTDGNENLSKKANVDPRERVIEEEKDIILSPQRGSFGTGCHVSTTCLVSNKVSTDTRGRDHHQERPKMDESNDGSHRTSSNHRRVGTGRIIPKERERANDWMDRNYDRERNYDHRNDSRDNRNDDYNDRRKGRFSYDMNARRTNMSNYNRNNRYDNDGPREHYRHSKEEDDEPEWFTGGPTSKHETIELRGFDDEPEPKKPTKDANHLFADKFNDPNDRFSQSNITNQNRSSPQKDNTKDLALSKSEQKARDKDNERSDDFDVNDMFKMDDWFSNVDENRDNKLISSMDVISNTATNECDNSTKSRFKQWFKESPINAQMSQFNDSSQNEGNSMSTGAFRDTQTETRSNSSAHRSMPSTYPNHSNSNNEKNIFDLLQGANRLSLDHMADQKEPNKFDLSKAKNVSEIEASLKQLEIGNTSNQHQDNDKKAFEKLINQLGKRSNPVPYDRVNNYVDKQSEAIILPTNNSNIIIPKTRQQMLSAPTILELLKEEENQVAFEKFVGSQDNYTKLQPNSSMSQISTSSAQMFNKINNLGPTLANAVNASTTQNWHNSAQALINPMSQRIPSPQELAEHTQNMMRNALIKRNANKYDDQRDQVLKAQSNAENIRNITPTKGIGNTKFSFTPTSVIRKMHSDKDKELANKSGSSFDEMTAEVQTSQQKFIADQLLMSSTKSSNMNSPRPILKSNNPFGQQSMPTNQVIQQNPVSSQTNSFQVNPNSESSFNKFFDKQQHQLLLQQQLQQQQQQQHQSQQASIMAQRQLNSSLMSSMPSVRSVGSPLNLAPNTHSAVLVRPSTPSPNANNNMQTRNMIQGLNNSNARPNSMTQLHQINQLMALQQQQQQQSAANDSSRQLQYSQSRSMPPMNVQQMLKTANNQTLNNPLNSSNFAGISGASILQNNSRSDVQYSGPFNNLVPNAEQLRTSTTYQQSRQQIFMNSGNAQSRNLGQWFGNEMLSQRLPDMPPVPLQNALTLEDLERP